MSIRSTRSIGSPGSGGPEAAQPPNAPARAWLPSLVVLVVVLVLAQTLPGAFLRLLGAPSAWLASLWLGGPLAVDVEGYWILHARQAVHVTNACNGAGFFALLLALTVPHWHRGSNPARCGLLIAAPIAGAILANSFRIIAVWYAARVTALLAIPAWAGAIHYISGLLVFFLFLVAYHISMERIYHENVPS
jgi:exosortase/archaeosortase family protein